MTGDVPLHGASCIFRQGLSRAAVQRLPVAYRDGGIDRFTDQRMLEDIGRLFATPGGRD